MTYVNNSTGVLKKVMLARPEHVRLQPINVIAKKWLNDGNVIDEQACIKEHAEFIDAYKQNGVKVHLAPTSPSLTNQVFARDFGACVKEGYILGKFREPIRFGETTIFEEELKKMKIPCAAKCCEGVFEGGDFWFLDDNTIALGRVERTDDNGFNSLRNQLEPLGYKMIQVPCAKNNLHLDMCFNIVAEKTAVAYMEALPDFFLKELRKRKFKLINIAQDEVFLHHCNLQCIGAERVLSFTSNKIVNKKLKARSLDVIEIELFEILKMGGGPHCMTFPIIREK